MSLSFMELLIAGLITWQIVEIWRHGSLFATARADIELWHTDPRRFKQYLAQLLECPFCLSVWVAWFVCGLLLLCKYASEPGSLPLKTALYGFAASRLANLYNDLTYNFNRTAKEDDDEFG